MGIASFIEFEWGWDGTGQSKPLREAVIYVLADFVR